MRLILTFLILSFILVSCGKKSEPKYQGYNHNLTILS